VVAGLLDRGLTVATGESLTAGLVCATLADVPGCSAVLRGGVVAYQAEVKQALLGVSADALAGGVVSDRVAAELAEGAARRLGADIGIGTTGVAGPDPHDGEPVGSVWIAVAGPARTATVHLQLEGGRDRIRRQTVAACWELLLETLGEPAPPGGE
jgi:nicotinamide-nucleotide amidase